MVKAEFQITSRATKQAPIHSFMGFGLCVANKMVMHCSPKSSLTLIVLYYLLLVPLTWRRRRMEGHHNHITQHYLFWQYSSRFSWESSTTTSILEFYSRWQSAQNPSEIRSNLSWHHLINVLPSGPLAPCITHSPLGKLEMCVCVCMSKSIFHRRSDT